MLIFLRETKSMSELYHLQNCCTLGAALCHTVYTLPEIYPSKKNVSFPESYTKVVVQSDHTSVTAMMSLAARSGALSPYMQATAFAVAGPLKALVPGVVVKSEKILLNPKKQFLCRESLNGQSPKTGPAVTVSINGKYASNCQRWLANSFNCYAIVCLSNVHIDQICVVLNYMSLVKTTQLAEHTFANFNSWLSLACVAK